MRVAATDYGDEAERRHSPRVMASNRRFVSCCMDNDDGCAGANVSPADSSRAGRFDSA